MTWLVMGNTGIICKKRITIFRLMTLGSALTNIYWTYIELQIITSRYPTILEKESSVMGSLLHFNLNAGKTNMSTIRPPRSHAKENPKWSTASEKRTGIQKAPNSEIPFTKLTANVWY